jgi:hypothetical protein
VVLRHVRDFVREHRSELRLGLRQQDQPGVHADIAAGQREGIDRWIGDREELEVLRRVGDGNDKPIAELVQVVVDLRVLEIAPAARIAATLAACALRRRDQRLRFIAEIGTSTGRRRRALGAGSRDGRNAWVGRAVLGLRRGDRERREPERLQG